MSCPRPETVLRREGLNWVATCRRCLWVAEPSRHKPRVEQEAAAHRRNGGRP